MIFTLLISLLNLFSQVSISTIRLNVMTNIGKPMTPNKRLNNPQENLALSPACSHAETSRNSGVRAQNFVFHKEIKNTLRINRGWMGAANCYTTGFIDESMEGFNARLW